MKMKTNTAGFMLIAVLLMISLCTVIVSYIAYMSSIFVPVARTMIEREKAIMLAESGVQLALSQLGVPAEEKKSEEEEKQQQDQQQAQAPAPKALGDDQNFLRVLLPIINRWQEISFTKKNDGFDGELKFCVVCENAKINLNIAYDFEKHEFASPDNKELMIKAFARLQDITQAPNLFEPFEAWMKKRKTRIEDVTELMTIDEFNQFKDRVFYEPPVKTTEKSGGAQKNLPVYLTDLFTIEPERGCVQPWVLSDSVCALYDFSRADKKVDQELVKKVLPKFKPKANWEADWDASLAELYGKKYDTIPAIFRKLLAVKFGLTHFSVVSYGTVGGVTQRVVAIVERKPIAAGDGGPGYTLTVKKRYRL